MKAPTATGRGYFRPKAGAALTPRELDCYRMMVQAYTRKETATQLGISLGSAKVLCFRVLAKSGAPSTGELIRRHAKEMISSPEVRIGPFE